MHVAHVLLSISGGRQDDLVLMGVHGGNVFWEDMCRDDVGKLTNRSIEVLAFQNHVE